MRDLYEVYQDNGFDPDATPVDTITDLNGYAVGVGITAGFEMLYPEGCDE